MDIKALLKNKGVRAAVIIFMGIVIVFAVTSCQKHMKNKNNQETDRTGESSVVPADAAADSSRSVEDALSSRAASSVFETQAASTAAADTAASEPPVSETEDTTGTTRVDYSINDNDFTNNIQGDFKYTVIDGHAVIDNYFGNGGAVKIPSDIGGYPVKAVGGSAFSGIGGGAGQKITSVVIAFGVERIESKAFSSCVNLTSVSIPDSVTYIGAFAFEGCPKLVIKCSEDSYARTFASENNMEYTN